MPKKSKVYPLGTKDKALVEKTISELESQGRIERTTHSTPFSYPVFVVWRDLPNGERKGRMVVDIRGLNQLVVPDVYPMPSQADILHIIQGCRFITVMDATSFIYQWRTHAESRRYLTISTYLRQHTFLCTLMGFCNTPAYTQREMDYIL